MPSSGTNARGPMLSLKVRSSAFSVAVRVGAIGRHRVAEFGPRQIADRPEQQSQRYRGQSGAYGAQKHPNCCQPRDTRARTADDLNGIRHRMKL